MEHEDRDEEMQVEVNTAGSTNEESRPDNLVSAKDVFPSKWDTD